MNYVFINVGSNYPLLYRHDVYGTDNPTPKVSYLWMFQESLLDKSECNLSLSIL